MSTELFLNLGHMTVDIKRESDVVPSEMLHTRTYFHSVLTICTSPNLLFA